ncbi:MAG: DUF3943 domain-containing protein [Sulfuricurvum sp.]|nr:DUF3943 domain-containing protein [Sulfuricurvum sp.]
MGYWTVLLLSIAIAASADNTLYDALKTSSSLKTQKVTLYDFSMELTPSLSDDGLSDSLQQYQISESLKEQLHPINTDVGKDYSPDYINVNEELPYRYKKLIEDSLYLQLLMISSVGFLTLLPESITSWNMEELQKQTLSERWFENVSSTPVWDNDNWIVNYIGHPVSGAFYYTMARNDGMSIGESAAFSALMSTFFWEYGYESFAETPSIQDLIFTPLLGSILGEGMIVLQGKLDQKGGVIFGSRTLGNISYFFLDPLGNIAHGMKGILKTFNIDLDVTMTIQTYPQTGTTMPQFRFLDPKEDSIRAREREIGFVITFW